MEWREEHNKNKWKTKRKNRTTTETETNDDQTTDDYNNYDYEEKDPLHEYSDHYPEEEEEKEVESDANDIMNQNYDYENNFNEMDLFGDYDDLVIIIDDHDPYYDYGETEDEYFEDSNNNKGSKFQVIYEPFITLLLIGVIW